MTIKHWFFTSDTHGSLNNFYNIQRKIISQGYDPTECGVIVLGDVGFNYFLDHRDISLKKKFIKNCGYTIYCLKGNHEARPQKVEGMKKIYDIEVCGYIYYEEEFPTIKYFCDAEGATYNINGYKILTIGGAYSVDKYYRLEKGWNWFENEQLTTVEREFITKKCSGEKFDFVLTHTCPLSWQPTDLFISLPASYPIDSSMEEWLEQLINKISYKYYLFGHYHDDRRINDKAYMLFNSVIKLEDIINDNVIFD